MPLPQASYVVLALECPSSAHSTVGNEKMLKEGTASQSGLCQQLPPGPAVEESGTSQPPCSTSVQAHLGRALS